VLSFLFVCLSSEARLSEVVILSADDLVYICFVGCLYEASCTGCCWWLGDAWSSSGFLCVSSHYLILPRVSSLVV